MRLRHGVGGQAGQGYARHKREDRRQGLLSEVARRRRVEQRRVHEDGHRDDREEAYPHGAPGRGLAVVLREYVGHEEGRGVGDIAQGRGEAEELHGLDHLDIRHHDGHGNPNVEPEDAQDAVDAEDQAEVDGEHDEPDEFVGE